MFAIIYSALMSLGLIGHGVKGAVENQQCINKAKEKRREGNNKPNIYNDRLGATRDLDTGKLVSVDFIKYAEAEGKDAYVRDMYGNPIRNLSEEIRQERLTNALLTADSRKSVVEWKEGVSRSSAGIKGKPYYAGKEYKDISSGAIYVCRYLPIPESVSGHAYSNGLFYMDISNGLLVREADSQKEKRRRGEDVISEDVSQQFVEYFNKRQNTKGYFMDSKIPKHLDLNGSENEFDKRIRLEAFYCNNYEMADSI